MSAEQEDRMVALVENRTVGEEPDVVAEVARSLVAEMNRQMTDVDPQRRVHVVTMVIGLRTLAIKVRAFGPRAAREARFREAAVVFRAVAVGAIERAGAWRRKR